MSEIQYRCFDQNREDPELIFNLFETIYGDSTAIRQRWSWEILKHPENEDVKIYVAETLGNLVGMTVRMPCSLMIGGNVKRAYFATNSMVIPDCRGQGVIRGLYDLAGRFGDVQLSKGTAPAMYNILKKIGYKDINPNCFQFMYLRLFRLILQRCTGRSGPIKLKTLKPADRDEMRLVSSIPEDIDSISAPDGISKDAGYLHWRYIDIPHKKYQVFERRESGKLVSMLVLRSAGSTVYLVDMIWDRERKDEPATSLTFAKEAALRMGAYKIIAWSSFMDVRITLSKLNFIDKGETPRFSFFCRDISMDLKLQNMNFAHGDGDIDYL